MDIEDRPLRAPGRRPTIRDVAREAKVSAATVSNVLTGRRKVAPRLAAKVREVVERVGYQQDAAASTLRSGERRVAGVLVPELTSPFFGALVTELEHAARENDKRLLIATSGNDPAEEAKQVDALLAWRPAGVIVVPCDDRFASRTVLQRAEVPFVAVDRLPPDIKDIDTVTAEGREAAAAVIDRLIAAGHRRVLAVATSFELGNMRERAEGAMTAAESAGGEVEVEVMEVGLDTPEYSGAVEAELKAGGYTAVFALSGAVALATLSAASTLGLRVPRDLSVAVFDDDEWMRIHQPPLSAVGQPTKEIARGAWACLASRFSGQERTREAKPSHLRLPCRLVWRDSVARPSPLLRDHAPTKHTVIVEPGSWA